MALVVYGNKEVEVVKEANKFVAREKTLNLTAESDSVTGALNELRKSLRTGQCSPVAIDVRV